MKKRNLNPLNLVCIAALLLSSSACFAQNKDSAPETPTATPGQGEQVNVDTIKEKYGARGDESELGVVQNRTYSKANKITLGVMGGVITSDPFLTTKSLGLNLGYHFSEYLSLSVLGWRAWAGASSALTTFQENKGATADTNPTSGYLGTEAVGSLLYGKLSVLGKAIIYYDFYLLGGLGATFTESGKYLTPHVGLGQRFYLSRLVSLRVDYRFMVYHEDILEKTILNRLYQVKGNRNNFSNVISIGIDFMLGR